MNYTQPGTLGRHHPRVIHDALPEAERPEFLRRYRAALVAAHDPDQYETLRRCLIKWRLTADALADYDALAKRSTPRLPD
jgi:hypothetical protein